MQTVTLKFANDNARYILYALRKRYGRNKNTDLATLCMNAVLSEMREQAKEDLKEAEHALVVEWNEKEVSGASNSG